MQHGKSPLSVSPSPSSSTPALKLRPSPHIVLHKYRTSFPTRLTTNPDSAQFRSMSLTRSLRRCVVASLRRCVVASLRRCVVASLRRCVVTSRLPCDDPPTPTSRPRRTATIPAALRGLLPINHRRFGSDSQSHTRTRTRKRPKGNESRIAPRRRIQDVTAQNEVDENPTESRPDATQ
jgi:hypothetical protein